MYMDCLGRIENSNLCISINHLINIIMAINKRKSTKTFNLDTSKMLGYHKPKDYKRLFIVEHVRTSAISIIAASSLEEAISIFTATNSVPANHIHIFCMK